MPFQPAEKFEGNTPLHWAAFWMMREIIMIMLNNGGNVNVTNDKGETALHRLFKGTQARREAVLNRIS